MPLLTLSSPTRVVFGLGALEKLPEERSQLAFLRPLVICDGKLAGSAVLARVLRYTGPHTLFCDRSARPREQVVLDAAELYVAESCTGIIAIGNGTAMETAKGVRLKVNHPLPLSEYGFAAGARNRITQDVPGLITVPTVAGAMSAVNPAATITLDRTGRRATIRSPYLTANCALCDPELSLGVELECHTRLALAAFVQSADTYLSFGFHPICDAIALESARLVTQSVSVLQGQRKNLDALGSLLMAGLMSVIATGKGPGVTHALAHALCSDHETPYAVVRALLLAAAVELAEQNGEPRVEALARQIQAPSLEARLRELFAVSGIPARLRDCGVPGEALSRTAEAVAANPGSLYVYKADEVEALLRRAW